MSASSVKQLINRVREAAQENINGANWSFGSCAGVWGRNTTFSATIEVTREISYKRTREILPEGSDVWRGHRFTIQLEVFERAPAKPDSFWREEGLATIWLNQAGQIITVGLPSVKYKLTDEAAAIAAITSLMAVSDEELIRKLYDSGYQNYGSC